MRREASFPLRGTNRDVVIADPCALSGQAVCLLAAKYLPEADCRHLTRLAELISAVREFAFHRTLVVTELFSATEGLSEGLAILAQLVAYRQTGMRVVVFTAVTDPFLLRLVLSLRPTAMMLRTESLRQVRIVMTGPEPVYPYTQLSPGVQAQLGRSVHEDLTHRQTEWWLTQADGLGLQAAADRLQVAYKTAASLRISVIRRLGGSAPLFARRMAALRGQTGFCRATPPSGDGAEA